MIKNINKIRITLQTPLSIGNEKSELLSPLCDYVIKGREVLYIDTDKLGRLVFEKDLMDDFVINSGQLSNTRTNFNLEQFIRDRLQTDPEKLALGKYHLRGRPDRKMYIRPLLRSGGKPFIPGSSIKGAIKTALLFNWLCNSVKGKVYVSEILRLIIKIYDSNKTLVDSLEKNNHEIDVLSGRIKNARADQNLKKRLKDQQYSIKQQVKRDEKILSTNIKVLDSKLTEAIEDLFGRMSNRPQTNHDFFSLRTTDSTPFEFKDILITEVKRLHLLKAELQTPQYMEILREKITTEFELSILPGIKHSDLRFLNDTSLEELWNVLNEFSKASAETDWDILDSHAENFEKVENAGDIYDTLFLFLQHLTGKIGTEKNTAHMRLGFGKTYFDNSLGLVIYKESPEVFMKYVKLLRLGKPRQTEFPVTRTVCAEPLVPMGWITMRY